MATSHLAATLVQEVPADSGNFPWYMTDSIVVVEDTATAKSSRMLLTSR